MIEKSFFIFIFTGIWRKFLFWYSHSFLSKIAGAIIRSIMSTWSGSTIRKLLFDDFCFAEKLDNSIIGGFFNSISRFFEKNSERSMKVFKNSTVLGYFGSVCGGLLFMSVRSYGIMLITFGVIDAGGKALMGKFDIFYYAGILSVMLGIALYIINRSIAGLYNGSILCRWFGGLFDLPEINMKEYEKKHTVLFILLGVYLALCALFLSTTYFVIAAGGIIGAVLTLYRTETGVMAAAFLIPLVPTKIILGLTMLTVISYLLHVIAGRLKFKFQLIDLFVFIFAMLLVYSVFISFRPMGSAPVVAVYLLFIAFYVAAKNTIVTKKQLFAVISIIILSGLIVSSLGIYQKLTGAFESRTMWLDSGMFDDISGRVYSTLENPNVLGEYLIIIISLTAASLYYLKKPLYKAAALGVLGISGYCMILTLSRGAWVGLLCAFAVFVLLNDRKLIWFAVLGLIIAPAIIPDSILNRFLSIGNIKDTSTNYRVNIWLASLLMLKVFWPVGIGLGIQSFVFIYSRFAFNAVYAPHSHNLFLQITIDLGIIGLLVFLCYIAVYFKNMLVTQKNAGEPFLRILPGALCAALAGYLLQGMTDNVWYNYRVVCLFWLLLAIGGALHSMCFIQNQQSPLLERKAAKKR